MCYWPLWQGEVMSPILFSLFIDDLERFLQDSINFGLTFDDVTFIILLSADDMAIIGDSPMGLQNSLNLLKLIVILRL